MLEFSSRSTSVDDFCRFVAHNCDVSIVTDANLGQRQVALELKNQPLDQVLASIARHLGTNYHQASPSLYFLGATRPQDEAVLVRRVRGLKADQIQAAIRTVSSSVAVQAFPDGLVVCSDLPETLSRVSDVLDQIEASRPGVWVVQLYLVTMSRDDMTDLGLDITPALDVALAYGVGSGGVSSGHLDVGLSALLTAARERSTMGVTAEPLFYLIDGESSVFERATQIPIARRAVSDQGTVTVTGYDTFKAGTLVTVEIREVAGQAVRLTYQLELSSLRAVTSDGFPSSDRRTYNGVSHLQSGGVYLLGSIDLTEERQGRGTWLHTGISESNSAEVMQIWARAVAVQGPAMRAEQCSIGPIARLNDFSQAAELPGEAETLEISELLEDSKNNMVQNPLRKESQSEEN